MIACTRINLYNVHQSRRNGKLPATRILQRCHKRWMHRSDEKPGAESAAGVSRVGRLCLAHRAVGYSRWLSGIGWFLPDRQQFTIAYALQCTSNSGQRAPATRWATKCRSTGWASQSKNLRLDFYLRTRFCSALASNKQARVSQSIAEGRRQVVARHGGGVRALAQSPIFSLLTADVLALMEAVHA